MADIAASFQAAAIDILLIKIKQAIQQTDAQRLVVAGGVAANQLLRDRVTAELGIDVAGGADAKLSGVTCSRCKNAVVGWACGATVTSSQVLAADGTPAVDVRPSGC